MNKSFFRFLLFCFLSLATLFNRALAQDTAFCLSRDQKIGNNFQYNEEYDYNSVSLVDDNTIIVGYLIIQLDSNTRVEMYTRLPDTTTIYKNIHPSIYVLGQIKYTTGKEELMVDSSLEKIDCDTCKIYKIANDDRLIWNGYNKFLNGERDDLTNFLYYYKVFRNSSAELIDNVWVDKILNTDVLNNKTIWSKNGSKAGFIIYKIFFRAAVLKLHQMKFFIPMSSLKYFNEIDENMMKKSGFTNSKKVILVK